MRGKYQFIWNRIECMNEGEVLRFQVADPRALQKLLKGHHGRVRFPGMVLRSSAYKDSLYVICLEAD